MDIRVIGVGEFAVTAWSRGKYDWNKDGTLTIRGDKTFPFTTAAAERGVFVEALCGGKIVEEGGDGNIFHLPLGDEPVTLRVKELPDPKLTKAHINRARQTVTRYVCSDQPYSLNIPDTLVGTIAWLQKHLRAIPAASRRKARCSFDTSREYGETYPNVEIAYEEKETDAEVIGRIKVERERKRIAEAGERAELARLQSKFKNGKSVESDTAGR